MTSSAPSPSATVDVESATGTAGGRSKCLSAFLLGSVLALYALVLAGGVVGFFTMQRLRADLDGTSSLPSASAQIERGMGSVYKMQNFAHLRLSSSRVKEGVLRWEPIKYGHGSTMGSHFSYDSKQASLMVSREGTYFLYVELYVSCDYLCANDTLSVVFKDDLNNKQLSCTVQLPDTPSEPVSQKCWTVIPHMEPQSKLLARIENNMKTNHWTFDMNRSGFGIFLVDNPGQDV